MNYIDKNKAVHEWLKSYPNLHTWLYFNTIINAPGEASMLTGDDITLQEYVDNSKLKNYIFQVAFLKLYDTGTSDINADALEESCHFFFWIDEQNEIKNFPDFNKNEEIQEIIINNTIPNVAVDQDEGVARYTINVVISYIEQGMEEQNG